jgi:hypothetical protein
VGEDPNDRTPASWSLVLRAGGVETIDLVLYRRDGFAGEVEVWVDGLPPGVSAAPAALGPGVSTGSLGLVADETAEPAVAELRIVARAVIGGQVRERLALAGTIPFDPRRPPLPRVRKSETLPLCVLGERAAFFARLGETNEPVLKTCRAGRLALPIGLVRRGDFQGNVYFYLRGGPRGMQQLNEVNLDGSAAAGTLELVLPGDCAPGRYTFSLLGVAEVPYSRNPEAAAAAAARKAAIEAALPEVQVAANRAAEARAAAEQDLEQARTQVAEAQASNADEATLARAEAALAAAEERLTLAIQAEAEAVQASEEAAAWFAEAERLAAELADAAAQRGYAVAYPSTPVTIDVADAPVELRLPGELRVAAGTAADLPVAITRQFGFEDAVSIELLVPGDAPGLSASGLYLEPQQTQGALRVEAAADAPQATYPANVRLSLGFNGQGVEVLRPISLTIEPAAPNAGTQYEPSP